MLTEHGSCAASGAQSAGLLNMLLPLFVQTLVDSHCALSPATHWPPDYGDQLVEQPTSETTLPGVPYDFVVVGAGSAGSVIASRLSEQHNWRVLVLEAGGDPPQEAEIPMLFYSVMHTNYTWNYWTEPTDRVCKAMRDGRCYWPRGRVVGGSGAINAMMYLRGHRGDYDGWLAAGCTGWGWRDVLPYFEKSVRANDNATHPQGYVALAEFPRTEAAYADLLLDAARAMHVPVLSEFGEGAEVGYAFVKGTLRNGERMSTGKGYLGKVARHRENLRVIKNAEATHINLDASGTRVESLRFALRRNGHEREYTVRLRKELIVSAGTINSPKLLQLSGIGPREHLASLGIKVQHDLPVGDNLQDHLIVPIFIKLDEGVAPPMQPKDAFDMLYEYLMYRKGQFTSTGLTSLVAFLKTNKDSDSPYPDVENHYVLFRRGNHMFMSMSCDGIGLTEPYKSEIVKLLDHSDVLLTFVLLSHPKSAGSLRLRSTNPADSPIIDANYLAEPEDFGPLLRGIRYLEGLTETPALRTHSAEIARLPLEECDNAYDFRSDEYWRCYAKYYTFTCYHHTSTVKMGAPTDPSACVDPHLRLRGVHNLRVADASIMPNVISANTNAATIMIAERAADFIKQSWATSEDPASPTHSEL